MTWVRGMGVCLILLGALLLGGGADWRSGVVLIVGGLVVIGIGRHT